MKTLTLISSLILGAGLCFAAPDGKCKKGDCKKDASAKAASADAQTFVVLDDDEAKPEAKPERKRGDRPDRGGERPDRGGDRPERGERPDPAERFKTMDKDSSGGISLAEFGSARPAREGGDAAKRTEMMKKFFTMLDKDKSGEVSLEEMSARRGGPGGRQRGGPRGERPDGAKGGDKGAKGGDAEGRPKRPPIGD